MNRRRLFFALSPDQAVREAIRIASAKGIPDSGRRVRQDNLHMTVQFLGNIDEQIVDGLIKAADRIHLPRFSLLLDQAGWWKPAQVAWLAPANVPPDLLSLNDSLHQLALMHGLQVDERPYRPHVTLARKVTAPVTLQFAPIHWNVTDFCLFETITHMGYVEYRIIQRRALT